MTSDDKPVRLSEWVWWKPRSDVFGRRQRRRSRLEKLVCRDDIKRWRRNAAAETVERAYRREWKRERWSNYWWGVDPYPQHLADIVARVAATAEKLKGEHK